MRIALVTEELVPSSASTAQVARELAARLSRDHDVLVLAGGRGLPTFHDAQVFWAGRMTPVSAVREAMALFRPDVCHLLEPYRLGLKGAEAADRLGVRTVCLPPESWLPGVDADAHHPGLRDEALHEAWTRPVDPGPEAQWGRTVVGYVGSTGDASGPHDHVEWHPNDGGAADPARRSPYSSTPAAPPAGRGPRCSATARCSPTSSRSRRSSRT